MDTLLEGLYALVEESLPYRREDSGPGERWEELQGLLLDLLPAMGKGLAEEYARLDAGLDSRSRKALFLYSLSLGIRLGALATPGTPSPRP